MTLLVKIIREPIVLFIVLGGVLYAATTALRPVQDAETITLRPETIRAALQNDADLSGIDPTPERRAELIQALVDDEVLLREAYALGYDQNDPRVRQRLLSVMRSSMTQSISDPSSTQLSTYYRANLDQFRTSEMVSFEQIYFTFANEQVPADPASFMKALNEGMDTETLGDYLQMSRNFPRQSRDRVVLIFGRDFADELATLQPGAWSGPLQSKHGIHYVRVKERHPSEQQTFEQVEPFLQQQWLFEEQRKLQQSNIDALRAKYEIILPPNYAQ